MTTVFRARNKTGGSVVNPAIDTATPLLDVQLDEPRTGRFVLHCSNIAAGRWLIVEGSKFASTQFFLTPTATRTVVETAGDAFQISWQQDTLAPASAAAYFGVYSGA